MSEERTIRIDRVTRSSPERVYRAFTDPEEVVRWFAQRVEGSLAVGSRSALVFERERRWVDVVEAEPNRRAVFRWPRDTGDGELITTVTVAISPRGMGSTIAVTDGPFPPGSEDVWGLARERWGAELAQLIAYLDFSVDLRTAAL